MNINTTQLQIAMAERRMSLTQLSERSGVAKQNISTIIRRGTCTPKTAGKLAAGLNVPVKEIVKEGTA